MSKTTGRNVKASVEVRKPKDELSSEAERKTVSGGLQIVKLLDKASAKIFI